MSFLSRVNEVVAGQKAWSLSVNNKLYAVSKNKSEVEAIKKEWQAEGDGLDHFEIKQVDFEGKLPWIHPNPGVF